MSEGNPEQYGFKKPYHPQTPPADRNIWRGEGGYRKKSSNSYRGRGRNYQHYGQPSSPDYSYSQERLNDNQDYQGSFYDNDISQPPPSNRQERRRSLSKEGRSNSKDGRASKGRDSCNGGRDQHDNNGRNHSEERCRDRPGSRERNHQNRYNWPEDDDSQQWVDDSGCCGQMNNDFSPHQQYLRDRPQNRRGQQSGYDSTYYSSSDGQTPGRRQRWDDDPVVFLSKTLSSILRHNAEKFGLKLMKGGFLYVDEIFRKVRKLQGFTINDVIQVVESNDKKRFSLEYEGERLKIRANQGHSIEVEELDLKPILSADEAPVVIHGTYYTSWEIIKNTGLNRMNRNHIHFAAGEPGESGVISGMRKTCEVMLYIDMEKALKDGLKFFRSANNVILSPGDKDGVIYPCYFRGALDRMYYYKLDFDQTISSAKNEVEKPSENKKRKKRNKGKNKHDEEKEAKDEKEARESEIEKKTENEPKEIEDGATTDDTSLPAAKKPHLSQSDKAEAPIAESSRKKNIEQENTRNENREFEKDEVKSTKWSEPQEVTTIGDSIALVNRLCENPSSHIAICCVGENLGSEGSKIRMIVISCRPESYVYHLKDENRSLVKDGQLEKLFLDKKTDKVFHDIGAVSTSLIHEFDILMDGAPIWDISILFGKVCPSQLDLDELGFDKMFFKQWTKEIKEFGKKVASSYDLDIVQKLYERGKLISDLFQVCLKKADENARKKVRKEVFEAAIPSNETFLSEKIKELKLEKKAAKKAAEKSQGGQQQSQQQKQQQQQHHGKQGKQKGKKK